MCTCSYRQYHGIGQGNKIIWGYFCISNVFITWASSLRRPSFFHNCTGLLREVFLLAAISSYGQLFCVLRVSTYEGFLAYCTANENKYLKLIHPPTYTLTCPPTTILRVVFSTLFSLLGNVYNHGLLFLIHYLQSPVLLFAKWRSGQRCFNKKISPLSQGFCDWPPKNQLAFQCFAKQCL